MNPLSVQEPSTGTQAEQFVFLICQHGAEPSIKRNWLVPEGPFRLAFSRPGLLTFKMVGDAVSAGRVSADQPRSMPSAGPCDWLIRQSGFAFGQLRGDRAEDLVTRALELSGTHWDAVHVFQRDLRLPGTGGFEPGPTELSQAIGELFDRQLNAGNPAIAVNRTCEEDARVLDVILIEPDHWLVGHHVARLPHQRWPGGAYPVSPPTQMISRAYLKMGEAIQWSRLPVEAGDEFVEIGSAPGGSCQRLLDLGLKVTGVDPAEMAPQLLEHPRFEHWRNKSAGIRRKRFGKFRWLAADANVAPNYTLDCVEDIVMYPTSRFEGLLLTFKLSSYELADLMDSYLDRVRQWGFDRVEVRQLASNRRECCVVAQRAPGWQRGARASRRRRATKRTRSPRPQVRPATSEPT